MIGDLLGITDRQVRNLISQGILKRSNGKSGMDPLASIHSYIAYKSQVDEPETPAPGIKEYDEKLDKEQESALDIRERRRARRIQNEIALKTVIPVEVVVEILGALVSASRSKLLAVEGRIATETPNLSRELREKIMIFIRDAMTDLKNEPIPASLRTYLDECNFDLDAAAEVDDQPVGR